MLEKLFKYNKLYEIVHKVPYTMPVYFGICSVPGQKFAVPLPWLYVARVYCLLFKSSALYIFYNLPLIAHACPCTWHPDPSPAPPSRTVSYSQYRNVNGH